MKRVLTFSILMFTTFGLHAQSAVDLIDEDLAAQILEDLQTQNEEAVPINMLGKLVPSNGVTIYILDRINGTTKVEYLDFNRIYENKYLTIEARSCYVPADASSSDAVSYLTIKDKREVVPVFDGWMIASSPALNALEHPRFDVWVRACGDVVPEAESQEQ